MAGRPLIVLVALCTLTVAPLAGPARADNAAGAREVIVAMVDTGVDVRHQEFVYGGPASTTDQVVAWWDFTSERKSADRVDPFAQGSPLWDTDIADPYDNNGHGTGTASLAVGRDLGSCGGTPKLSFAPGFKLAIAKVGVGNGTISGNIGNAIRWATDVVHADVISMSIGSIVPAPNLGDGGFEAIQHAKDMGVTVVVSAGNGAGNFGLLPYPTEMSNYGASNAALAIGGGSQDGNNLASTTGNDDPDVASWSDGVCLARVGTTGGYVTEGGTSFAAPLVAGMAADAIDRALANGHASSPDQVFSLLKHCARDTILPYAREGWGFLLTSEVDGCVRPNAAAGTIPTYAAFGGTPVNPNEAYASTVAFGLRTAFSANALVAPAIAVRTPAPVVTGPGDLGPSAPAGAFEAEGYTLSLAAGETASVAVTYTSPCTEGDNAPDLDVAVVPAAAYDLGVLTPADHLAGSANPGCTTEAVHVTAAQAGDYVVLVYGFLSAPDTTFHIASDHALPLRGEAIWAGVTVV